MYQLTCKLTICNNYKETVDTINQTIESKPKEETKAIRNFAILVFEFKTKIESHLHNNDKELTNYFDFMNSVCIDCNQMPIFSIMTQRLKLLLNIPKKLTIEFFFDQNNEINIQKEENLFDNQMGGLTNIIHGQPTLITKSNIEERVKNLYEQIYKIEFDQKIQQHYLLKIISKTIPALILFVYERFGTKNLILRDVILEVDSLEFFDICGKSLLIK